jgi:RimJ/RimL family protein N-acetyltransferase
MRGIATNVELVPHRAEHLDATYSWLSADGDLRRRIDSLSAPASPEANEACWRRRWADASRRDFAIIAEGRHVGNCGLCDVDMLRRKAQMWIYLGEKRGAGVGSRAVRSLLAYAFGELGLHRVYIRVLATNDQAVAFYERLGFALEGIFKHDTIQNGRPIDSYAMAIVSERW